MATMNISLPKKLKDWVESQTDEGSYSNASDYVRDLIRRDQQRAEAIARLQAEIDIGIASGISDKTLDEVFAEAKQAGRDALRKRDAA